MQPEKKSSSHSCYVKVLKTVHHSFLKPRNTHGGKKSSRTEITVVKLIVSREDYRENLGRWKKKGPTLGGEVWRVLFSGVWLTNAPPWQGSGSGDAAELSAVW